MTSSWNIIRIEFTKGKTPKSTGYMLALTKGADLFVNLSAALKDREAAEADFNADTELRDALFQRFQLESIVK